jgi:hypothetical protein
MTTPLPTTPKGLATIPGQRLVDAQTMSMIVALASQQTVMRARIDACERLLVENAVLAPGAIDAFVPDATAQAERDLLRQQSMTKIFRALHEAGEADLAALSATNAPPLSEDAA